MLNLDGSFKSYSIIKTIKMNTIFLSQDLTSLLGVVALFLPIALFALVVIGLVKRNRRLWLPCLIGLIFVLFLIFFLTTLSSTPGIQRIVQ